MNKIKMLKNSMIGKSVYKRGMDYLVDNTTLSCLRGSCVILEAHRPVVDDVIEKTKEMIEPVKDKMMKKKQVKTKGIK